LRNILRHNNFFLYIIISKLVNIYRMNNLAAFEQCLDECNYVEYVTDVSTTKLSDKFIKGLFSHRKSNISQVVSFTMYYRTFDVIRIAYHGKVSSVSGFLYYTVQ
jgi:hypothetical protein